MHTISACDESLTQLLRDALGSDAADLPADALRWELPKDPSFGDLSNSVAFKLAARRRQPPVPVAHALAQDLMTRGRATPLAGRVDRIEAKAGFLNVFLSTQALAEVLRGILRTRDRYGTRRVPQPPSINIEFVSANPTGPLSVAHGRQAAVGDVLARLLRSQGARVTTEFYLNDEGRQMELVGRSLRARCLTLVGRDEPIPEDGYQGEYLLEVARQCLQRHGHGLVDRPVEETLPIFTAFAMEGLLGAIRADLERFGLRFNRWTSQRWLRTSGRIHAALKALADRGACYDAEDATWFASSRYGDDKDRVLRKRDGELTYLASDIAYHQWKCEQGYDQLINLWGPDHHGYIARVKAAMSALGLSPARLDVRIVQLVTLSRRGTPVPMSKRQGEFVTFREILDEVGVDASRFFFLMRTMDSHLDFDLELAKAQSQDNPVYYVQYAHARICSILAKVPWHWRCHPARLERLTEPEAGLVSRLLFQYPMVLHICAVSREPHGLTTYLRRLAEAFHVFYTKHRVIGEDRGQSIARLALVRATRQVLANGLGVLGVSAPQRM